MEEGHEEHLIAQLATLCMLSSEVIVLDECDVSKIEDLEIIATDFLDRADAIFNSVVADFRQCTRRECQATLAMIIALEHLNKITSANAAFFEEHNLTNLMVALFDATNKNWRWMSYNYEELEPFNMVGDAATGVVSKHTAWLRDMVAGKKVASFIGPVFQISKFGFFGRQGMPRPPHVIRRYATSSAPSSTPLSSHIATTLKSGENTKTKTSGASLDKNPEILTVDVFTTTPVDAVHQEGVNASSCIPETPGEVQGTELLLFMSKISEASIGSGGGGDSSHGCEEPVVESNPAMKEVVPLSEVQRLAIIDEENEALDNNLQKSYKEEISMTQEIAALGDEESISLPSMGSSSVASMSMHEALLAAAAAAKEAEEVLAKSASMDPKKRFPVFTEQAKIMERAAVMAGIDFFKYGGVEDEDFFFNPFAVATSSIAGNQQLGSSPPRTSGTASGSGSGVAVKKVVFSWGPTPPEEEISSAAAADAKIDIAEGSQDNNKIEDGSSNETGTNVPTTKKKTSLGSKLKNAVLSIFVNKSKKVEVPPSLAVPEPPYEMPKWGRMRLYTEEEIEQQRLESLRPTYAPGVQEKLDAYTGYDPNGPLAFDGFKVLPPPSMRPIVGCGFLSRREIEEYHAYQAAEARKLKNRIKALRNAIRRFFKKIWRRVKKHFVTEEEVYIFGANHRYYRTRGYN